MKKRKWMMLVATLSSGALMFQNATCAQKVTAASNAVTAGGVIFIINQIIKN